MSNKYRNFKEQQTKQKTIKFLAFPQSHSIKGYLPHKNSSISKIFFYVYYNNFVAWNLDEVNNHFHFNRHSFCFSLTHSREETKNYFRLKLLAALWMNKFHCSVNIYEIEAFYQNIENYANNNTMKSVCLPSNSDSHQKI